MGLRQGYVPHWPKLAIGERRLVEAAGIEPASEKQCYSHFYERSPPLGLAWLTQRTRFTRPARLKSPSTVRAAS